MSRTAITLETLVLIQDACRLRALEVKRVAVATIAITRDSMVRLFPDAEEEYYAATAKVLSAATPNTWTDRRDFLEMSDRRALGAKSRLP
jgi:hypothetical protein